MTICSRERDVAASPQWTYPSGFHRLRAIVAVAPGATAWTAEHVVGEIQSPAGPLVSLHWQLGGIAFNLWRRPGGEPKRYVMGAASPAQRFCFHLSAHRGGGLTVSVDKAGTMRGYTTHVDEVWAGVPLFFRTPDDDPALTYSEIDIRDDEAA
jgi:hypothetical protein